MFPFDPNVAGQTAEPPRDEADPEREADQGRDQAKNDDKLSQVAHREKVARLM
jgi:hypothetical protein